jgi:hypothetical protein
MPIAHDTVAQCRVADNRDLARRGQVRFAPPLLSPLLGLNPIRSLRRVSKSDSLPLNGGPGGGNGHLG